MLQEPSENAPGTLWERFENALGIHWEHFGNGLGMLWERSGNAIHHLESLAKLHLDRKRPESDILMAGSVK